MTRIAPQSPKSGKPQEGPTEAGNGPSFVERNYHLGILRDHRDMRTMIWIVGLLALVTSLDLSLYGGLYTRGTVRMFSERAAGFGF